MFLTLYILFAFNSAYSYKIITEIVFIRFLIKNCTICYTGQSDENKDYVFNDQNKFNLLKDLKLLIITDFFNWRKTTLLKLGANSALVSK